MRKADLATMSVEALRAEVKKTTALIATTRARLSNQEQKLLDLQLALLDKLENGKS